MYLNIVLRVWYIFSSDRPHRSFSLLRDGKISARKLFAKHAVNSLTLFSLLACRTWEKSDFSFCAAFDKYTAVLSFFSSDTNLEGRPHRTVQRSKRRYVFVTSGTHFDLLRTNIESIVWLLSVRQARLQLSHCWVNGVHLDYNFWYIAYLKTKGEFQFINDLIWSCNISG